MELPGNNQGASAVVFNRINTAETVPAAQRLFSSEKVMDLEGYHPPQSVDELLRRYQAGERHFHETCLPVDDEADYVNLRGVTLEGADFSASFFTADFRGANLRYTRFRANVKTCDFRGADLTGAEFREAAIDSAEFWGAILDGTDFTGAGCYGHTFGPGEMPLLSPETYLTYDAPDPTEAPI